MLIEHERELITIDYDCGSMTFDADAFFPLTIDKMKIFKSILKMAKDRKYIIKVLEYLNDSAIPYNQALADQYQDAINKGCRNYKRQLISAKTKVKRLTENAKEVEKVLEKYCY